MNRRVSPRAAAFAVTGPNRRWLGALVSLALLALAATAAPLETDDRNIRFRRLSLDDGLSQAFINSIVQDQRGFMWFGTQEGLNLFDGHDFTVFSHDADEPNSVSHDLIKVLIEDRDGILWLGTDGGGLNRFDPMTRQFTRYQHERGDPTSIGSNRVWALLEDRNGRLWVGTDDAGVYLFDRSSEEFTRYALSPDEAVGAKESEVKALAEDPSGAIWVATEGAGLIRLGPERGSVKRYLHDPEDPSSLSSDRVRHVMVDSQGSVWASTYDAGLDRLDLYSDGFIHFRKNPSVPGSLAGDSVRIVFEGRDETIWVGTDEGLSRYRKASGDFQVFKHDPADNLSLSHDNVMSIYEDRGGVLWVGTFSGLNTWNTSTGYFFHHRQSDIEGQGLSNAYVSALAEDRNGDIWIATFGGGLNRLVRERGTFDYFLPDPEDDRSIGERRVMSVYVDQRGTVWAGTFEHGLFRLNEDRGDFTRFSHDPDDPSSLSWNGVTVMAEDSQGEMWVATFKGGVNRFNREEGTFERYQHDPGDPESLSSDRVLALLEDRLGNFWIGTYGAGLNLLDRQTGRFSVIRHDPDDAESLSKDDLMALFEDSRGDLWIGTQGGGLNRWSLEDRDAGRQRFTRVTTKDGLPSNTINAILEDDTGDIWVSTNSGLSRIDPETRLIKSFDTSHGLQGEFNYGAGLKTRGGEMYFGGIHGFNTFRPERIVRNEHVPPVVITRVLKFNESLPVVRDFSLKHSDAMLTFEFSALDYTAPERNRYRYRLEGFDKDWVDGSLRRAIYTNLPPGSYSFRVKGSNNDGFWNETPATVSFRIGPPWWRTWWAYCTYALSLGLIIGVNTQSQAKKRRRAQELAKANEALQLEIEQRKLQGEALRLEKERAQRYLDVAEVIMLVVDSVGVVTLVNQKGAEVLGYPEEEIVGQKWVSFVPPSQREEVEQFLGENTSGDYLEYSVINFAGEERIVAWHMTFLRDEEGCITGSLSSGSDVTQMLRLREAKESAESASRAKSQFLANMSHEIRTPMNGVLGMIELLMHSKLNERQKHFAESAHRAAQTLLDLLNDILDLSKIEAGKLELEEIEFSPRAVLDDVTVLFRQQAQQRGLRLSTDIAESVPEALSGDPVRLRQILSNLVGNAIKFTENGGVSIAAKVLAGEADEKELRFEVRDTGVGLSREKATSIFEAFQQADGSTTRRFGGTGLGLNITRQLVELMGGTVGVESVEGAGSLFWCELPLNGNVRHEREVRDPDTDELVPTATEVDEQRRSISAARILLVEDNPLNQEVVRGMLDHLGGHADVAGSGEQALRFFKSQSYDLILMDCQMPVMDGYEATRRIRDLEARWSELGISNKDQGRSERVPVVAMTASALAGDRERCLVAGMDDYLGKPFTLDQLGLFLGKWIQLDARRSDSKRVLEPASDTVSGDATIRDRDGSPIDSQALDEIRDLERSGVVGLFDRLLNIYVDTSPELVEEIEGAVQSRDARGLHAASHSLKSTSASLGASYLATLCRDLEMMGRSGDLDGAGVIVENLVSEFERVRSALLDELRQEAV